MKKALRPNTCNTIRCYRCDPDIRSLQMYRNKNRITSKKDKTINLNDLKRNIE